MSRDYKKPMSDSEPAGSGGHGFLWGLLIGLTVAGVLWFQSQNKTEISANQPTIAQPEIQPAEPEKSDVASEPASQTLATAEPAKPERKSRFAFYKLLRDFEVVIPAEEIALNAPPPVPEVDANAAGLNLSAGEQHKVQVGSFRSADDAERRRAEVALLGLVTAIQTVEIGPGEQWNRVYVGPFVDPRQIEDTLDILAGNGFGFLVTKVKNPATTPQPAPSGETTIQAATLTTQVIEQATEPEPALGQEPSEIETIAINEPTEEPFEQVAAEPTGPKYKVQIGSFRSAEDAERRRAEIGLLGLSSDIQQVEVGAGQTWNRVFIGPLNNQLAVDDTLATLKQNGFDYLLTKVRDKL